MYSNFQVEKVDSYEGNKQFNAHINTHNNGTNNNGTNNNSSNNNSVNNNSSSINDKNNNNNDNNNNKFISVFKNFLNGKSDTILSVAGATAIAFAFKDLVLSIATNIIHPLFRLLMIKCKLNNYVDMGELNKSQNMGKNLMNFITTLVSFISIIIITYYSIKGLNNTFNILDKFE